MSQCGQGGAGHGAGAVSLPVPGEWDPASHPGPGRAGSSLQADGEEGHGNTGEPDEGWLKAYPKWSTKNVPQMCFLIP